MFLSMGVGNRVKLFNSVDGGREFIVDVKRQGRPGVKVTINVIDFRFCLCVFLLKKKEQRCQIILIIIRFKFSIIKILHLKMSFIC